MKKNISLIFALSLVLISVLAMTSVEARPFNAHFINSTSASTDTLAIILSNYSTGITININLTGTDTATNLNGRSNNITRVNITFPIAMTNAAGANPYVAASQNMTVNYTGGYTAASAAGNTNASFSTAANTTHHILSWVNGTPGVALINITHNISVAGAAGEAKTGNVSVNITFIVNVSTIGEYDIVVGILDDNATAPYWNTTALKLVVRDGQNRHHWANLSAAGNVTTGFKHGEDRIWTLNLMVNNSLNGLIEGATDIYGQWNFSPIYNISLSFPTNFTYINASENQRYSNFSEFENTTKVIKWHNYTNGTLGGLFQGQNWTAFLDFNVSHPGIYTLYLNLTDNKGTVVKTFTVNVTDRTNPENITFACSPTSIYQGETETCTCSGADNEDSSLDYVISTIDTSSTGTFTETCTATDNYGNAVESTSNSYTVNSNVVETTTGTGGAGSGYTGETTHNAGTLSSTETTVKSDAQENLKFKIGSTTYIGTVDEVTSTTAKITLMDAAGENKEITLTAGGTPGKVDLDNDGVYDVAVTLSSVSGSAGSFVLKQISETVPAEVSGGEAEEEGAAEEEEGGVVEEVTKAAGKLWLWIVIGAVVVIAVVVYFIARKK